MTDQIHRILTRVQKPARYVGGEYNQIVKRKQDIDVRVAFCFPDTYEIGMSNIGMRILYGVMNEMPGVWCERVFAPWGDMEAEMRAHRLPLWALESHDPVRDFDLVAFTLGYEMCYSNVLNMLELSGLPLLAKDRKGLEGIVFAGGVCTVNPEPLADFIDFFSIGEGEESTREIIECYRAAKRQGLSKQEFLREAAKLEGVYVPSLYTHTYNPDGTLAAITPAPGAPARVKKRIVQDLDRAYFPTKTIVPSTQIVHDRSNLEIFRGCIRGCRFCQAGFCYRPIRAKSADTLCRQAIESLEDSGNSEITLASLSTSDYRELEALADGLLRYCEPRKINLSLPSLRADNFSRELMLRIQKVRKSGLTFAPEAGTQRLRDVINKGVTEEDLLAACENAFENGWSTVKLYFMMGLPTETDEDLAGIADLAYKVLNLYRKVTHKNNGKVTVSVSSFVPKSHTAFQWFGQLPIEEIERKQQYIKGLINDKHISYHYHDAKTGRLEATFARGDRRMGKVLYEAWKLGCKFDGWTEMFDYDMWMKAFDLAGIDPDYYAARTRSLDEALPWDHLSNGAAKAYLKREWQKASRAELTHDCRRLPCTGCGVCPNLGVSIIDRKEGDDHGKTTFSC